MRSIHKKFVSFILLSAMFLLCISAGSTQADSSLMYGILHHTDSVYETSNLTDFPEQLSAENAQRMVSVHDCLRQESRRTGTRTNRVTCYLFLIVRFFSQLFPVIFAGGILSQAFCAPCNDVIIRYIHNKDGKKNN